MIFCSLYPGILGSLLPFSIRKFYHELRFDCLAPLLYVFRYKEVILACSLNRDLDIFQHGDETEVSFIYTKRLLIGYTNLYNN